MNGMRQDMPKAGFKPAKSCGSLCHALFRMMFAAVSVVFAVLALVSVASCSDDDDGGYYPSVVTDMMLVSTDEEGMAKKVALDDGTVYDVLAQRRHVADGKSVFRVMGRYTIDNGHMTIYGMESVYCRQSYHADSIRVQIDGQIYMGAQYLPRDPVKLISMWKSGSFVNLYVGLMTSGLDASQFVFSEDSVGHYSLVHRRRAEDGEAYTKKRYLSMPVPSDVDTLTFSVKTYDGWVTKGFRWR